jgi:hypothetical protein
MVPRNVEVNTSFFQGVWYAYGTGKIAAFVDEEERFGIHLLSG